MAQNVNKSQHGRPHNSTNNESCCHGVTGLHTISEEVCKAMYWFPSLHFAAWRVETLNKDCSMHCTIMIQITGWNCMSGLCTCEMKENIFLILLFGQYDVDTFERIGTVNSVRTGLLRFDSWTEERAVYLPGMSEWWGMSSIQVNRDIFSDTTVTNAASFCQCCGATLHLPSTVCFWRKFSFQQNARPPPYHNVSNFLNDHFPGSSIVHWVKAKYPSLCPYLIFLTHLLVGNHIN